MFLFPVIFNNVSFIFVQEELEEQEDQEAVDAKGLHGWDRVEKLAAALINMEGLFVTNTKAEEVRCLYDNLPEYDKQINTIQCISSILRGVVLPESIARDMLALKV